MFAYKVKMTNIFLSSMPTIHQIINNIEEFTDSKPMVEFKIEYLAGEISKASAYGGSVGIDHGVFCHSPQIFYSFLCVDPNAVNAYNVGFSFFWCHAFGEDIHLIISEIGIPSLATCEIKGN